MEDIINRIFDKLENADVSPSANYSMPEYYMHCAMSGREREKRLLFNWISMSLGIDVDLINKVFDERYNNIQNESRNMRRTIRLRESELKRMIAESVRRVLNESDYDGYFDWPENSGASDDEIETAGKKHDERKKGNSFQGDKLAYRQHAYQMFKDRGENSERQKDFKKATIKRQRNGWKF